MAEIRVNPTRMELKKLQARYTTARRGHKLLKDKRDGLMKQFLEIIREDKEVRTRVEKGLGKFYAGFSTACAVSGAERIREALMMPKKEGELTLGEKNVMSVRVPVYSFAQAEKGGGNAVNYGFAFTSGELDASIEALSAVTADLLRMAELEKSASLLAREIEKTRRRVNALEYIMMPQYLDAIKSIKMKLDENERGNTTRLMKVKDMMLAKK